MASITVGGPSNVAAPQQQQQAFTQQVPKHKEVQVDSVTAWTPIAVAAIGALAPIILVVVQRRRKRRRERTD